MSDDENKDENLYDTLRRSTLRDLAKVASEQRVMININFSPYDEDGDGDIEIEPIDSISGSQHNN